VDYITRFIFVGEQAVETVLLSEKIQIERKQFFFDLKENPPRAVPADYGRCGRSADTIIIPATGLEQIRDCLERAIQAGAGACWVAAPES
jgi:hypothetical protein